MKSLVRALKWVFWLSLAGSLFACVSVFVPPEPGTPKRILITIVDKVYLRSSPNTTATILSQLPKGQQFDIFEQSSDMMWWHVTMGNLQGWIADNRNYIKTDTRIVYNS